MPSFLSIACHCWCYLCGCVHIPRRFRTSHIQLAAAAPVASYCPSTGSASVTLVFLAHSWCSGHVVDEVRTNGRSFADSELLFLPLGSCVPDTFVAHSQGSFVCVRVLLWLSICVCLFYLYVQRAVRVYVVIYPFPQCLHQQCP
eukprot:GHVQ01038087.1.p1 GENE.GHVQ01038087.1~~GHVQ01038087.1.p1  ORF type:complete len:144 (+),score=3.61 GHVQ01038087.1:310-741(+)